jgi:hypothetical protein
MEFLISFFIPHSVEFCRIRGLIPYYSKTKILPIITYFV